MKHSLALLQPEEFEGAWLRRRKEDNKNDDKVFEVGKTGVDIRLKRLRENMKASKQ
jgi:hypothetical protein